VLAPRGRRAGGGLSTAGAAGAPSDRYHECYRWLVPWQVLILPAAQDELDKIPAKEAVAIATAVEKLKASGPRLGYPHSSAIKGARKLRELRPRRGDSPWRAF